jgi:hypothetical protein
MVGQTAMTKRAPFLALLLAMVMVLLYTSDCEATSSIMKGNASSPYHARIDEAADHWMFDSEITRMLADKGHFTDGTKFAVKPAIADCNRPPKYITCLPPKAGQKQNCGTYHRGC